MSHKLLLVALLLLTGVAFADDAPAEEPVRDTPDAEAQADKGPKLVSGMSILGNQEAPTSLVIVPWKSSVLGDSIGIATMLNDSRQPIDRDVFMRELSYYEIRSHTRPQAGLKLTTGSN